MDDFDKWFLTTKDFKDIEKYRELLIGKTVLSVDFLKNADEGLKIQLSDNVVLEFGFNGCEGEIKIFIQGHEPPKES